MTRLEALKELARKVEAGEFDAVPGGAKYPMFNAFMDVAESAFGMYEPVGLPRLSWESYNGSLNDAKALHEAVLPGWSWNLCPDYCHVIPPYDGGDQDASTGSVRANPARAWLLAIIKALITQEEALQDLADADRDLI